LRRAHRRLGHGLSTEQSPVSAYVGSSKNLKDPKGFFHFTHFQAREQPWLRENPRFLGIWALRRQGYEASTVDSRKPRKYIHLGALRAQIHTRLARSKPTCPFGESLVCLGPGRPKIEQFWGFEATPGGGRT